MSHAIDDCLVIQFPFESRPPVQAALAALVDAGVASACILFTCQRSELFVVGATPSEMEAVLTPIMGSPFDPTALIRGHDAIAHIVEVACGLQSHVLGEVEILGQMRASHAASLKAGICSGLLDRIMQGAIAAGKRVRAETDLGHGTVSIASAIHAAAAEHARPLNSIVIVGAGTVGRTCARLVRAKHHEARLTIINRGQQTAAELAAETGATADTLESLPLYVAGADLVVVAVGDGASIDTKVLPFDDGCVVVDVSSPQVVDPSVRERGVRLFELRDIEERMDQASYRRKAAIPQARQIIGEEIDVVETWSLSQRIVPLLRHVEEVMRSDGHHEDAIDDLVRSFRRSIFSSIRLRRMLPTDVSDALHTLASWEAVGS